MRLECAPLAATWAAEHAFLKVDGLTRLWARDATLWTNHGEDHWLGWLDLPERAETEGWVPRLTALAEAVRAEGTEHVVVVGMGGSSLCPEVLATTFRRQPGWPELLVLDSTHPDAIARLEARIDAGKTIVVVQSKSGSTLEPNLLLARLLERIPASQCIAVTDPGSSMETRARSLGFREVIHGMPSVGGRFSALSPFGLVPAALMGLDVGRLVAAAKAAAMACRAESGQNPGLALGLFLGANALLGRDKLTLSCGPSVRRFGAWIEQLVAESTGKDGRVILPIEGEPLAAPDAYGEDRMFVRISVDGDDTSDVRRSLDALEDTGAPVLRLVLRDAWELGGLFFVWEVATAVAGALLGVNPFDQPDVEASKLKTRTLTGALQRGEPVDVDVPSFTSGELAVYGTAAGDLESALRAHLGTLGAGDAAILLAYLPMTVEHELILHRMQSLIRDRTRAAASVGFGPRFLHSTGQAHKGGPNHGVFIVLTHTPAGDLPVPGEPFTFGQIALAQALGDTAVLTERGRRVLRVHLTGEPGAALARLHGALAVALVG